MAGILLAGALGLGVPVAGLGGTAYASGASGGYGPNVCKLLPAATVARLIGQRVPRSADKHWSLLVGLSPERYAKGNQCDYSTPADPGYPSVLVMLIVTNASSKYQGALKAEFETPTTVAHLGNRSFFDTANGLYELWGKYEIEVTGTPSQNDQSMSQNVAIAKALMKALR